VFFRGFIQREIYGYTNSLSIAVATESLLFALGHSNRLTSGLTGIYFGLVVDKKGGDLGFVIPTHFWLDVVDGLLTYFTERRAEGKNAPLNPPLKFSIAF
jgi:membrane protease YdiL (CAAX protease family)